MRKEGTVTAAKLAMPIQVNHMTHTTLSSFFFYNTTLVSLLLEMSFQLMLMRRTKRFFATSPFGAYAGFPLSLLILL